MKKLFILMLFILSSSLFAQEWKIEEGKYEDYVYYVIKETPSGYESLINSTVFAWQTQSQYRNLYTASCEKSVLEFLNQENFEIQKLENQDCAFFPVSFMEQVFPDQLNMNIEITKDDLKYIWKELSSRYAGFSEMKKSGLNKKEFMEIKNSNELKSLLDKYVEDCHFNINIRGFSYSQNTAYDEGSKRSLDPENTYFEKESPNAYYVRFTSCSKNNNDYFDKLPDVSQKAMDKDFIILDARTNNGGSDMPQFSLRKKLQNQDYKGTVIVLQDNWSFSSGEVWHVYGVKGLKYKCLLVGTHSGGMQNYGNCETYENKKLFISMYFGYSNFRKNLPANYLGDGKGYEPDIWATTENMKSVLEELGVDLTGITFQ